MTLVQRVVFKTEVNFGLVLLAVVSKTEIVLKELVEVLMEVLVEVVKIMTNFADSKVAVIEEVIITLEFASITSTVTTCPNHCVEIANFEAMKLFHSYTKHIA